MRRGFPVASGALLMTAVLMLGDCDRQRPWTPDQKSGESGGPNAAAPAKGAADAGAASANVAPSPPPPAGDPKAGEQIAAQGGGNGGLPCVSCHGQRGEGSPTAGFPRLAGQSADYLRRQLEDYASGTRKNAVMAPIAQALNAQQRADVAAHYAALDAPPAPTAAGAKQQAASANARALVLTVHGDESLNVQACGNCHGPQGIGEPPTYPYLAGQHQSYLTAALKEWQDGSRNNDPSQQMPRIAKSLSESDVAAVAAYYAALPPPAPMPPNTPASGAGASAPSNAPAVKPQGNGVEQGGPNTGSNESQGGGGAGSGNEASGPQSGSQNPTQPQH